MGTYRNAEFSLKSSNPASALAGKNPMTVRDSAPLRGGSGRKESASVGEEVLGSE